MILQTVHASWRRLRKPSISIARLRVTTYGELYARLRKRYLSLLETSEPVRQARQALVSEAVLSDQYVASVAEVQGFEEVWMTEQDTAVRARASTGGERGPAPKAAGRTLPAMMQAAAKAEPQPARVHITVGMAKAGQRVPPVAVVPIGGVAPPGPEALVAQPAVLAPPATVAPAPGNAVADGAVVPAGPVEAVTFMSY